MKIEINVDNGKRFKRYDESLFEVYCLDYGDNYHRLDNEPTSEFERAVRNIKARYKDIRKFNEAMGLYNEWMNYLAEKHGNYDILKKKIKAGLVEDYVPRKPRLKNIKTLKYLYKHNIVISKVDSEIVDGDKINDYIRRIYSSDNVPNPDKINVDVTQDREAVKLSKESNNISTYKSKSFISDAEFLESFFTNKNKEKKKSKKKKNKKDRFLITDLMNGKYDDYDVEDSENAPLMSYNGLLLSSGMTKDIDVYHKLDEMGWHSYKLMKRAKYGKRVTSMFKAQKKSKKKKKKNKSTEYDDLLIDIMTDNGYDDFEDFQKEMLSMTSKDLFT